LNGGEFNFGMLMPNEERTVTVTTHSSKFHKGGEVTYKIEFTEYNDYIPDPIEGSIFIEALPRPQLAYSYQIIDDNSGNSVGNGNGKIEKGEAIDLLLTVKNAGGIEAKDMSMELSIPEMRGLLLNIPRVELGNLAPDVSKTDRLTFTVKKTYPSNEIPIDLLIRERNFNVSVTKELSFNVGEPVAAQVIALKRTVVAKEKTKIYGSADRESPVIARLPQSTSLLATGQLGDWYEVSLPKGRKGWVETGSVTLKEESVEPVTEEVGEKQVVFVYQELPPTILIVEPAQREFETASKSLTLKGLIKDDEGLKNVEIRVNGRPVVEKAMTRGVAVVPKEKGAALEWRIDETVTLQEGRNIIEIFAYDIRDLEARERVIVQKTREIPEIWACIIGISNYSNVRKLNYADDDAKLFYSYLVDNLGVPKDHIWMLLNRKASLDNIKRILGDEIRRKAGIEDQVMIYFAGHGAVEDDPSSLDGDGLSKYLLAWDTNPENLYSTGFPMEELGRIFSRLSSERVVFMGDACYSGASGGRTVLARATRATLSGRFLERLAKGKGRIILTASGPNELSVEDSNLGHGVFTYYLLKALGGASDYDGDGFITVDEAFQYLSKEVPQKTGQSQHPVKKGESEYPIIIGKK